MDEGCRVTSFSVAARHLPVTRQTLHRWRNNGLLRPPYLTPDGRMNLEPDGHLPLVDYCRVMMQVQHR